VSIGRVLGTVSEWYTRRTDASVE